MTMKSMKMKLWGILMICMALSACKDDDEVVVETTYVPFGIYVDYPVKNAGDEAYPQSEWYADDSLAVMRTDERTHDKILLSQSSGSGFSGKIDSETDTDAEFAFLYPAAALTPNTNDTLTQVLYLGGQDGTLEGIRNYDYTWGSGMVVAGTESYTVTAEMVALTGVCKFQFVADDGSPIKRIHQVILTSPSGELYQNATLDLTEGTLDDAVSGSIKVVNESGVDGAVYLSLFPGDVPLHFTLSTTDGKTYEASTSGNVLVEQGGYHVFDPIVCSPLSLARVGDYYYNDATWSAEMNPEKTCIGVVYALENESGKVDGSLSSSSHGRVVALKDCQQEMVWALSSGDVEDIENYDVLCDTLTIGSLPYWKGTSGSFFDEDAVWQLGGIGMDESTGNIVRWYSSGALSDFDGEYHSSFINGNVSKYPAATYSSKYSEGMTGWYLPSLGELALLWVLQQSGFLCEDTSEDYENLERFGYWSSSECEENKAWYINFYSGMVLANSKQSNYNVRPVLRF